MSADAYREMCAARQAFVARFREWLREASRVEAKLEADGTASQVRSLVDLEGPAG